MGHRHTFGTPQLLEMDSDPSWNHAEQPYMHLGTGIGSSDSSTIPCPFENSSIDGTHFNTQWNNNAQMSNVYASSSSQTVNFPHHYHPEAPLPPPLPSSSRNPFLMHPSEYNNLEAASSSYGALPFHGVVDGSFFDATMCGGDGRGPFKRKSPGLPAVCDRGSTSSSSNLSLSSDKWPDKLNPEFHHPPWEYRGTNNNSLSIGGDNSLRNVRSRATLDLEANFARTHLSNNPLHDSYAGNHQIDHSTPMDISTHNLNTPSWEWDQTLISPHPTALGSSVENGGLNINSSIPNLNHVHQNTQSTRGARSNYSHRSHSAFGVGSSSSNMRGVHEDERLQLGGGYSSRQTRPFSNMGWRSGDRSGRVRMSSDRYRMVSDGGGYHDRFGPEGGMVMDRSHYRGSRSSYDHHRDMRLDVDDMSYEELLALGERIGSVNTGLSGDSISKCLTESIYCLSNTFHDEGTCVICLEEYKNMDDVGMLRGCRHDFHAGCIRKWLSMKNVCPICKSAAMTDDDVMKNK